MKTGPKVNLERHINIIKSYLMPRETLESVARAYGITRQRVEQIINGDLGRNLAKTSKKELSIESGYFKCAYCGEPVKRDKYCSYKCRRSAVYFDLKNLKKCTYCGVSFFPFRNWEKMRERSTYRLGEFCCQKHYIEYLEKKGITIRRHSTIDKKNLVKLCVGCGVRFEAKAKRQIYHSIGCYRKNQGKR